MVTGRAERVTESQKLGVNGLRASIYYPYWLADATTPPPGGDLEVRQPPTLTLEGPHRPQGYDLRGCEHCFDDL